MISSHLEQWQQEIAARSNARVVLVPISISSDGSTLTIPPAFEGREVVAGLLSSDPAFVAQVVRAHALTVNWTSPEQSQWHFILLNTARAADWPEGKPDAVLAHELGHIWLHSEGYRSPTYTADIGCAATHAGDIVHHMLIRAELRRRGIGSYDAFWTAQQDAWRLSATAPAADALDGCARMQLLSACCDALLGYTDATWQGRAEWLAYVRGRFAPIAGAADELCGGFAGRSFEDRSVYEWALARAIAACLALGG